MPTDMIKGTVTQVMQKLHTSVWQIIWHYFIMNPSERELNKISTNFLQMKTQRCENLVIVLSQAWKHLGNASFCK